jgi:hypothetical protein
MLEQSQSWIEMQDLNFIDISSKSLLPPKWKNWSFVLSEHKDDPVKPINMYSGIFGERPKLISIKENVITLEQHTYSDIYLLINFDKNIYAIDKAHQRQFYMSRNKYNIDSAGMLSNQCFRMFMPWIVDYNVDAKIYSDKPTSFNIMPKEVKFFKRNPDLDQQDTEFIDFYFTNSPEHMIENDCGIIEKGSYIYTISFIADDILLKQIQEMYDK